MCVGEKGGKRPEYLLSKEDGRSRERGGGKFLLIICVFEWKVKGLFYYCIPKKKESFQHMQKLPGFHFGEVLRKSVALFLVVLDNHVNCAFSTLLLACMCACSPAIITPELINSSSTSFSLK